MVFHILSSKFDRLNIVKQNSSSGSITINISTLYITIWFKHPLSLSIKKQFPYPMEYFNLTEEIYNKTSGLACEWLK